MASVPVYTAEATSPRPRSPNYIPTGELGLEQRRFAGAVSAIGTVADRFAEVQGKIQNQSDAAELVLANGQYETAKENAHQNVSMDPEVIQNPSLYVQKFDEQLKEAVLGINDGLSNNRVKALFANHVNANYEKDLLNANAVGLKKQTAQVQAKTAVALNEYSKRAAKATPAERDKILKDGEDLVNFAWKNGFYPDEVVKQKVIETFRKSTFEKNMNHLAENDPNMLRMLERGGAYDEVDSDTRLKIMKRAAENLDHKEKAAANDFLVLQKQEDQGWQTMAFHGTLPDDWITAAVNGENPYISPERAEHFKTIRDKAVTTQGKDQILAIRESYHMTIPNTFANIEKHKKDLQSLSDTLAVKNPEIDKLANEMQSDYNVIRNANSAEMAAKIKAADDSLGAQRPQMPPITGIPTNIEKGLRNTEEKELRTWIRQNPGKDANEKILELLKRRDFNKGQLPQHKQDIQNLR